MFIEGVHGLTEGGIHGRENEGAFSIVVYVLVLAAREWTLTSRFYAGLGDMKKMRTMET